MIRCVETDLPPADKTPMTECAARRYGLAHAYGTQSGIVRFWTDGEGGWLTLMDGHAVLDMPRHTLSAEWVDFISMLPGVLTVRAEARLASALAQNGWTNLETGTVMCACSAMPLPPQRPQWLSPREAYPLLRACFGDTIPPFDGWYVDLSHRLRHDAAMLVGFVRQGHPVSCAMTVAQSPAGAVIGGVATLPDYRHQGFASAAVLTLTRALLLKRTPVWLCPKNESAHRLYASIGFQDSGRWGTVHRPMTL